MMGREASVVRGEERGRGVKDKNRRKKRRNNTMMIIRRGKIMYVYL